MQFSNDLAGGIVLVRPALRSPDYVAGASGWTINLDGSAEFNDLTIRGTFYGDSIIMDADGVFVYNGTPAAGNLIGSIAAATGTDSFGNDYLDGISNYLAGGFMKLANGGLWVGDIVDNYGNAGFVGGLGSHGLVAISPQATGFDDSANWALIGGDTTVTPRSAVGYPHFDVGVSSAGITQWINGAVIYSTVNGGVSTAETWHTPAFNANWATTGTLNGNATFRGLQYRIDAEDNVWLLGAAVASGAGASLFTLPAGYRPPANMRCLLPAWVFDSSAGTVTAVQVQVTEAGVVNAAASLTGITIATGDQVWINGKFPLGNVA